MTTTRVPSLGPRGEGWVVLQFVLFGVVAWVGVVAAPWSAGSARVAATAAGLVLIAWGVVQGWMSFRDLGPSLTAMPRPHDSATMRTGGIYAHVRHPMYGAAILVAGGWALARGPLTLVPALALAVVLDLKSRREEAFLADRYPDYEAYRDRVRHRFFPSFRTPR